MICAHDIIAISGLAVRVYRAYKDVPDHRHISEDIAALRVLIDKVASHIKSTTISNHDLHYGQKTLKGCQGVLEDLNSFIEKYKRLASINKRLVFNSVRLGREDITVLHVRLISNTGLLNGFVRCCDYSKTQAQLAALLGTNSRISLTSVAAFAANTNTETAFKQFQKDLYQIGIPEDLIQEKEDKIREILKSQGMVASRQICHSEPEDRDQVLETAYKEYCKTLYELGFTEDLLPPKARVLKILESRGVVASSQSSGGDKDNNSSTKILPSFRLSSRVNWLKSSSETGPLVHDATNEDNSPPLQIPVSNSHSIVELLSGKGSSTKITGINKDNTTPLHLASGGGYTGLVEVLLGNTPSNLAVLKGYTGALELLLFGKGAPIEAMDKNNNIPLHLAAWNGHADIVDLLLTKGASIEAVGQLGRTPLHFAAIGGDTRTVELLLEKGASTNTLDTENNTALHLVASNGHADIVGPLLRKGASIKAMGQYRMAPLHCAAQRGHTGTVERLLKEGASIEALGEVSRTPLHYAALGGNTATVELLLEKGASLRSRDGQRNPAQHLAAWKGHTDVVDLLLRKGVSIEDRGLGDRTLLHEAAQYGHTKLAGLLLKKKASTEVRNWANKTPLDLASEKGYTDIVQLLTNKPAEPVQRNRAYHGLVVSREDRRPLMKFKMKHSKGEE